MDILAGPTQEIIGSCRCYENVPQNTESHTRDFVLVGSNDERQGLEKFVLGIKSTETKDIWSRQSAGRIGHAEWNRASRVTRLILLR